MSNPAGPTAPATSPSLIDSAIELAHGWVATAAGTEPDAAGARLAGVLQDEHGLEFTVGFVDGVMRPESLTAAATQLARIAPLAPSFLPWYLRAAVKAGGFIGPALPVPTVPVARRVLRDMVGHLVVDARPEKLGPSLAALREGGARLNLNLLGEAVLGEAEAQRRLDGIHDLIRRDDVDYVSVKVSAIASHLSMFAFDELVDRMVDRLLPLYLTALEHEGGASFINLDMEEYRDLDLTVAVFIRLLEDPRLQKLEAGIVLQAYLPDALPVLQELTAWARRRVADGGAPIKVRLVKGANLAMERVDAIIHGWPQASYTDKVDTDANYLRCLDEALTERNTAAVRIGVAGHNLFDIAYAWLLAGERGVRDAVEFEMLLGMAQGQVAAVRADVGAVLLYVPVVRPDEFDVAISYLVRRLEENASPENFLSAAIAMQHDDALFEREKGRFLAAVARAHDPGLSTGPRRHQDRTAAPEAVDQTGPTTHPRPDDGEAEDLTAVVLDIARGSRPQDTDTLVDPRSAAVQQFGGDEFVETAVFSIRETVAAGGAAGFSNAANTDPALASGRTWAREVLERAADSEAGSATITAATLVDDEGVDRVIRRVRRTAAGWGRTPAAERAVVLQRIAREFEARRAQLIEVAISETGKVFAEADAEVSEAVDFAAYYAATCRELDRVAGAVFEPSRLTLVTPPWNFPLAIPAGGVVAALAAGSGVILKPAPQARRCAAVVADAIWAAFRASGVARSVLALVDGEEDAIGEHLVTHSGIDRVILTGSWETARLFRSWRPELPLLAETSGKNAMIITPSADLDLAVADLVSSAFGHGGQKCSAASLAILVGPVGRSRRFARQLVDAVSSLRVGDATDPLSEIGPLIQRPEGKLRWALTTLEAGESWLVEPQEIPGGDGRLWRPGVRAGVERGSRMHQEEFFGPVLGIMHAASLAEAVEMQNEVAYGLTAGLYTQNPDEVAFWIDRVEAGNLYVNRGITGAIVQRQPFGGWKRSAVGPGAKAGGPNYLVGLGTWRASGGGAPSSSLHLRGLDSRITEVIEAAQPSLDYEAFEWLRRGALSDAVAWHREFGRVKDASQLHVERNLLRYRPVPVSIRAAADAPWRALLRTVIAGVRAGSALHVSTPTGMPAPVRHALADLDVSVSVETDAEWLERFGPALAERPRRVRLVGSASERTRLRTLLAESVGDDPDVAVYADEVTTAGRIELLPFLREQAISITAHRFGNPDTRFDDVI